MPTWNQNRRSYSRPRSSGKRSSQPRRAKEYAKKSGADWKEKDGRVYVHGWNVSRSRGYVSFIANPAKREGQARHGQSLTGKSRSGREWVRYVVKMQWRDTGVERLFNGFWYPAEQKLRIPDLRMVASCRAPRGGYFGSMRFRDDD